MYREDGWMQGFYVDNHKKYKCISCEKEFIVGEELMKDCRPGYPCCPYCGKRSVQLIAETDDNMLQEIDNALGCVGIGVHLEDET